MCVCVCVCVCVCALLSSLCFFRGRTTRIRAGTFYIAGQEFSMITPMFDV